MLLTLFLIAAAVFAASVLRPPQARWQRAATWVAAIVLLAVLIAWGIEWMMQTQTV